MADEKIVDTTTVHNEKYRTKKLVDESGDPVKVGQVNHPTGFEVYKWPEFKAFCKRLGIEWEAPTIDLCIYIPLDGLVKITTEYLGDEMFNMRKAVKKLQESSEHE